MKWSIIVFLITTLLFSSCTTDTVNNKIEGIYATKGASEFSVAYDTLKLERTAEETYQITRNTSYQKISNSSLLPKKFKKEQWLAHWIDDTKVLSEADFGRKISFDQDGKFLTLRGTQYLKIR